MVMHAMLGINGWQIFSGGMSLWFFYSLPIFVVVQGLLGIPIPFNPNPLTATISELTMLQWSIMGAVVITYNIFLVMVFPYFFKIGILLLKGVKYAELKKPDENDAKMFNRSGIEDEFRDD